MVCCKQVPSLGAGRMAAPWRHGAACGALRKIRAVLNGLELERACQAPCTATRVASAPHSSCRTVVASVAAGVDRLMGRSTPTRGIVRTSVAATAAAAAGSRTAAAVVLGIESSCDDTGVAVVTSDGRVLGEAIATQADIHAQWGGVVPNLARDAHAAAIDRTVDSALAAAGLTPRQLTAIAVTIGPGLGLCLRVGAAKARDMARQYGIPLVSVHHMEAHALVARLPATAAATAPPAVRLTATLSPTETAPVAAGGPPAPHQLILRPDVTDTQPHVPEPQLPEYNGNRTEHEAGNHVHREEASPQEVHQHSHREMRCENARFVNGRRNGDGQSGSASACRPEQQAALSTAERAAAATVTAAGSAAAAAATTGGPAVATSAAVGGAAAETGAVTQAAAALRGAARGEIVDPAAVLEQIEGIAAVPFPFLCLLVSGGHNLLVLVRGVGSYMQLGSTVDDALGEAYDKVARLLNLELRPHGGAALEALAREGDPRAFKFKVPMRQHATCDFSFAGLKTSTRLAIEQNIPVARPQDPVATQAARDALTPAAVQTPPPAPPPCSASTSSMAADNDRSPMALANQIDSTASSTASSSLVTSSALPPSSTTTTGHSTARLSSSSSAAVATPGILLEPSAELSSPSLSSASLSLSAAAVTTSEGDSAQVSMPMSATELRRVKANIAASFQSVAVTHLMEKTRRAVVWAREVVPELRHLVVAGGVASNKVVRESLKQLAETDGLELVVPPARWCTDNGVMVAWTGLERLARGWAEPPPPPQPPCTSITSPTQGSYLQGLPRTAAGTAGTQAVVTETPTSASSGLGEEGVGASGGSGGGWSSKEGQGQVEADWIELKPRWPLTGEMHPRAAAARKEERRSLKRVRMHIPLSELTPPPTPSVASPAVTEARGLGGGSSGDGSSVARCSEVGVLASALV